MRDLKNRVRQLMREKREELIPEEKLEKSMRICRNVMSLLYEGETVMAYASKDQEVNTMPILEKLLENGNQVVVPIIVRENTSLRLSYLREISALVPSTFGVPEPIGSEIPADPEDIDTILLPMLGFDRKGRRLGYGAGYYDRFLAKNPRIRKIGIAFACQESEDIPVDENDIHMNCIVTEEGIVYTDGIC